MAKKISDLEIKIGADSSGLRRELNNANSDIEKAFKGDKLASFNAQMDKLGGSAQRVAEIFIGFGAMNVFGSLTESLNSAVKSAMSFESAMADVKKVVDFDTPKQFKEMEKDIVSLSQKIPMTAKEISQIVAAGGQSGIAREDLLAFAESAAKMGIAFDVTADQAGEMMAKWRTAFKMGQGDVVELADKINYLGNNTAASAPKISEVVSRIGPLGAIGGVASGEIAALGASMVGAGVETEIAATGIKNLILSMTSGASATKSQREAFKALGLDATEMAQRMQTDAQGAILSVFDALSKIDAASQASVMADLFGKESIGAIAPLLSNLEAVKKNLDDVADSSRYTGSMEQEFAARSATTENQLALLKNSLEAVSINLGSVLLPYISSGAQAMQNIAMSVAKWAEENKDLLDTMAQLTAGFIAFKTAQAGLNLAKGAVSAIQQRIQSATQEIATEQNKESTITANQQKQIERRIKAVEAAAARQEKAVINSIMKQNLSYEEQTARIIQESNKIAVKTAETANQIRVQMTAAFEAQALVAQASAERSVASLTGVGAAATTAGERIAAAHGVAAETAAVATEAEVRLAEANVATGAAATIAGDKNVAAKTVSTAATAETTLATETLSTATATQGNVAVTSGQKTVGAMALARTGVISLTKAVWALAAGWYGVAAAIAYAMYQSAKRNTAAAQGIGKSYYEVDGITARKDEDGTWLGIKDKNADIYNRSRAAAGREEVENDDSNTFKLSDAQIKNLDNQYYQTWYNSNDPEAVAERTRQETGKAIADQNKKMQELLNSMPSIAIPSGGGGGGSSGGSGSISPKNVSQNYSVESPIGELVASIASQHPEGEKWMGGVTADSNIQCDSFTANVYNQAGIESIGGRSTDSRHVINEQAFQAAGAYHKIGDGYEPQAGDLVDFAHHVGIVTADGKIISRQSKAGVHTANVAEAERDFGPILGYGSIAEATGGRTTTKELSGSSAEAKAAREAKEAARKLAQARQDAINLYRGMVDSIGEENDTSFAHDVKKNAEDINSKRQHISKLANSGLSKETIDILNKKLDEYAEAINSKVSDKWKKVNDQMVYDAQRAYTEMTHDYLAMADVEYDNTIKNLDRERKEREKNLMRSADDWERLAVVTDWYYSEVEKAEKTREKSRKEAHDKYVQYLQEEGNLAGLIAYYQTDEGKEAGIASQKLAGEKALATAYVKLWNTAHASMQEYASQIAETAYNSLSDSMAEFIRGTKSAKEVFQDFGNSILSMMAKIAAQRLAASWMSSLFGGFGGGGSVSSASTWSVGGQALDPTFGFGGGLKVPFAANGGIVTAPTLAMVGEGGESEAIIPLSKLSSVLGNNNNGNGASSGVTVNITNKSNSEVEVQNASYDSGLGQYVLDIVIDGASRNKGGFGDNLKTALGAR